MVKADWVHGPHAFAAAWSTAALARTGTHMRDTSAVRYNVLVRGFDTGLIAGTTAAAIPLARSPLRAWWGKPGSCTAKPHGANILRLLREPSTL